MYFVYIKEILFYCICTKNFIKLSLNNIFSTNKCPTGSTIQDHGSETVFIKLKFSRNLIAITG